MPGDGKHNLMGKTASENGTAGSHYQPTLTETEEWVHHPGKGDLGGETTLSAILAQHLQDGPLSPSI